MGIKEKEKVEQSSIENDTTSLITKENIDGNTKTTSGEKGILAILLGLCFHFLQSIGRKSFLLIDTFSEFFDKKHEKYTKKYVDFIIIKLRIFFKHLKLAVKKPMQVVNKFVKFIIDAFVVVKKGYRKNGKSSLLNAIKAFGKGVKNNVNVIFGFFNYVMPISICIALVFVVNYTLSLNYAVAVEYNGNHVGYIEDETIFRQAEERLRERIIVQDDEDTIQAVPTFKVGIVEPEKLENELELVDTMIKTSSSDIVKATGIKIDGKFYGAVREGEALEAELEKMRSKFRSGNETEIVKFAKDVVLEPGLYVAKNIREISQIQEVIEGKEDKDVYYQIIKGDTPSGIAEKNGVSLDELVRLNPDILKVCLPGSSLLINKSQPFLPISVSRTEVYSESIPFDTNVTQSSKYYRGYEDITKKGQKGEKKVTAQVEYVDGVEVSRTIITSEVVKNPITQQVTKGTGYNSPEIVPYAGGDVSDKGFIWPVTGGYVSSGFGGRWGALHSAIDIAGRGNMYGRPIRAAQAGKVSFAGLYSSFGRLIIIDHGGGLQTYYAHCSTLNVSVGQVVSQGQHIANVGTSGRVTGPHLHFEVRINGKPYDPLDFL